jgi:hypothetical protein
MSQNKKRVKALILSVASHSVLMPLQAIAGGGEGIRVQQFEYAESDDRIAVEFTRFLLAKDIGTDFSVNLTGSVDVVTGATPVVDASTGASIKTNGSGFLLNEGSTTADSYTAKLIAIEDEREALSGGITWRTAKRHEWSFGVSHSEETDFVSKGVSIEHVHQLHPSRNRSLSVGVNHLENQVYFLRDDAWFNASSSSLEIGLAEVLSPQSQLKVSVFGSVDSGALSNPYKRIIREVARIDQNGLPVTRFYLSPDARPDERFAGGVALKLAQQHSMGDTPLALHGGYRFYSDDWGIVSHTADAIAYLGESSAGWGQWMLGARYMWQSAADFYGAETQVFDAEGFGSVDERLGDFSNIMFSVGWERSFASHWVTQLRVAKQKQSNDLEMGWGWLSLAYTF